MPLPLIGGKNNNNNNNKYTKKKKKKKHQHSFMEAVDPKTSPKKDVNNAEIDKMHVNNPEVDDTAPPNCFEDPLLVGSFKLAGKAPNIRSHGAFYTELLIEKTHYTSKIAKSLPKNMALSLLKDYIPIGVGSEVFVDTKKFCTGKKSKLVVFGFAVNAPNLENSFCIVINNFDNSFFSIPLGSLRTELQPSDCSTVVEENWANFMTWNEHVMATKAQYQELLPPPLIPAAPVPVIPQRESSGRASFLKARQKLFEQQSPTRSPAKPSQSNKNNGQHECGCEVTLKKQAGTIMKLQGAVREQGASIFALASTVKELQATVANLVSMRQPKDQQDDTAEPPTKKKRGQRGPAKKGKPYQVKVKEEQSETVLLQGKQEQSAVALKNNENIQRTAAQPLLWPSMAMPQFPQLPSPAIPSWPVPFQFPPPPPQMPTSSALQQSFPPPPQQGPRTFYGVGPNGILGWHTM
jgi:hypothetical protein